MKESENKQKKIAFFGHFGSGNFGNESTLRAILYHLRFYQPDAEVVCITTNPKATAANHQIEAIPISENFFNWSAPRNRPLRIVRKLFIGIPSEFKRWIDGFMRLRSTDMLIIPGTGLLTDACGLLGWGPYNLFKWSFIAKACRCKLVLVSIGAGPIYGTLGRCFVRAILSLADFRSYRDTSTKQYIESIGFPAQNDLVYPDLAFSLPDAMIPHQLTKRSRRPVVGVGVMEYAGKYSVARPNRDIYLNYLKVMMSITQWLLSHEYDVKLLISDIVDDMHVRQEFMELLRGRISECDEKHVIDEPIRSVEDLLTQLVSTDIVVATRFHNVLLALVCNKPVVSISFHHKCSSLMNAMGLSKYCVDINNLTADKLIEQFCDLERNAGNIKSIIREKAIEFRWALDEQYGFIFKAMADNDELHRRRTTSERISGQVVL